MFFYLRKEFIAFSYYGIVNDIAERSKEAYEKAYRKFQEYVYLLINIEALLTSMSIELVTIYLLK